MKNTAKAIFKLFGLSALSWIAHAATAKASCGGGCKRWVALPVWMAALVIGTLFFSGQAHATVPTVTSGAATSVTATGATLNGTVNPQNHNTTITFNYGLTTGYGSTVTAAQSPLASGSGATAVSAVITGLACNTTYHFQVQGANSSGTSYGSDMTFTTSVCAPSVTTNAATTMTSTGATLNGTVSSNGASTAVTFNYGLTTAYGSSVSAAQSPLAAGASGSAVSAAVTGLTCNTLYHFRASGTNSVGTTNGGDLTFTTSACPSVTSINTASTNPTAAATAVAWTVVFSTSVTGVDVTDFALVQAGGVSGATITSLTGSGTTWTVNANTGSGTGTLGLNLADNDSIVDGNGAPLGGAGAGNGNFTGQVYTVSPPFCSPPSNIAAGVLVSCVCDTFGRTTLNPSTIFGGNWNVSTSDTTGVVPYINQTTGHLRLTENTGSNAKAASVPGIFPAAGNYISVEFQHYAYNGTSPGADGMAVTLSDYSVPAVPGAFGGSLGFAQKTGTACPTAPCNGFAGGWLGVGLDEYGNYQNPTEGRILGPGAVAESVGLRGPGSGVLGYRWMGGTGSSPGGYSIDSTNRTSTTPAPGYMYQVIVDARNSASGTINISVNRDATTMTGANYTSLFGPFNAYTEANYALGQGWITQLVPNNWEISFTGSTGGSTNIHELGSVRICAQTVAPPTGGTASGFNAIDQAYGTPPLAVQNYLTGHIYTKLVNTPFSLNVAALSNSQILTTYAASASKTVIVKLVDNSNSLTNPSLDCTLSCTSTCTSMSAVTGGTQTLTFASGATDKGQKQSPSFTINSAYQKLVAIISDGTTSACSTDSFSVRPMSIASVTSSNAINTGAPFAAGSGNFSLTATTNGVSVPLSYSNYNGIIQINPSPASPATYTGIVALSGTPATPAAFSAATPGTPSSTATGSTFVYSEVGAFQLPGYTPDAACTVNGSALTAAQCNLVARGAYDNTWTAVDSASSQGDCVAGSYSNIMASGKYGCNFGLLPNAVVFGRFVPDHFNTVVTPGMPCPTGISCPTLLVANDQGFVYSGQPFTVNVYALNAAGAPTQNYDSTTTLSKQVTLTAWDAPGSTVTQNPPSGNNGTLAGNTVNAGAFKTGATTSGTPATPTYSLPNPYPSATLPPGPTNIYIRAADTDSVTSSRGASSVEGGIDVASGRIYISNAQGIETLPLPIAVYLQYFNGSSWVNSSTDKVTTLNATTVSSTNWTSLTPSSWQPLSAGSTWPAGATSVVPATASVVFTNGAGSFTLTAPSAGNTGSVNIVANSPTYLPSNPARATFGVYNGANQIIYLRENY